jgi:GMP synthase (glutamine-hydrolysing)
VIINIAWYQIKLKLHQIILIIDFGSQYTQLIARRIRELNVYCEIHPWNNLPDLTSNIKGVILSGSPFSTRDPQAPKPDLTKIEIINMK